ncbi:Phosphatidylserine decarboxylase [Musa troglodytarum]|uniref:Phosphatidylserine decarboxylase proenzyme 2 n=1 Tax=Musa troglodytarum TaxID=320322 RepID=A0A9E7I650_9LILI|nr:Phosphatidylserine decarboxylase [Musa troglodytarum]URE42136.1 Phosphatidylserine decarboxylase [Musa troglodytarum]URE42137.1 Phosphatidylserine decarboxylase [Musa troglodytarum]URE42138.1 Phosphatidylserine decarboxylase [Musa troglodytarum]
MGHGSSRADASDDSSGDGHAHHHHSRFSRFRRRFRTNRHCHGSDPPLVKNLDADDFAGIARIEIISAEMQFKDRWFACLSLGERTYRTETSDHTEKPIWKSEKKLVLEKDGPTIARISVFETNRLSKNNLVGYCEINLLEVLSQESEDNVEELSLLDPSSSSTTVGSISILCYVEDPIETEKFFAHRILSVVDLNGDGKLSYSEFAELINAFGNQVATTKSEDLFKQADKNGDGVVDMDELATLIAVQQENEPLINNCPVCGESLGKFDKLNDMIHMTLCFDEGTGNQVMTGGFLTDKEASYGWIFKFSEWAHVSSYDIGLRSGSSASHILVVDRRTKGLVEEIIDGKIVLSMRAIYQSKVGLTLINTGVKDLLQNISEKQGKRMNSHESAKDIPQFIEFFKGQLKMDEAKYPIEYFKTFNEFFVRELKPGVRPIAYSERDDIAICAADCRLMAFSSANESLRFWIKGRKFSIQGLLGKDTCSSAFVDGSLVIFRLAPQDYHRFHVPVSGTIESFVDIPGYLYTVNPIAVNSKYCNVFTENKRVVSIISTSEFGKVAFVAIGATMVGSITFTKNEGDYVHKGDEFGYFSFGGSTVICVFEKDAIQIDEDLLSNSERSLETLVSVGMRLGISKRSGRTDELPNMETCKLEA